MYRTHHFVRLSTIVNGRARGKVFSPAPICRSLSTLDKLYPRHDSFSERHIGPGADEKGEMLDFLGFKVSHKFGEGHYSHYSLYLKYLPLDVTQSTMTTFNQSC